MAKSKKGEVSYVIAIQDYEKTMENIANGTMYVSTNKDEYPAIIDNYKAKVTSFKEMKKFIKQTKQDKKEVRHYWECLISNGYTLLHVTYAKETPSIESLFNNNTLKLVCTVG